MRHPPSMKLKQLARPEMTMHALSMVPHADPPPLMVQESLGEELLVVVVVVVVQTALQ